jgi:ubiquinone/menaquinone biosynthesis C-methylase UbiE
MRIDEFERWAEVYDIIYGEYKDDIQFYSEVAQKSGGKVLEVACGTGRVYLEMLKEGVDAYGLDISENMLGTLKKKAAVLGLKPKVELADMRDFTINRKFSLIIIPFRAFLHNISTDDQIRTLKNCRKHLAADGKLILNFFLPNPETIAQAFGKEVDRIIDSPEGPIERITITRFLNVPDQIVEFMETVKKGNAILFNEIFKIAFIYKREFELLLRLAGYSKWQVYGGFAYQPLTTYRQEMVWIAEK